LFRSQIQSKNVILDVPSNFFITFRNFPMKSSKGGITKKCKTMDYTNYAYNEAVGRLKVMLADNSYVAPKLGGGVSSYLRNLNEDSGDNFSDNLSVRFPINSVQGIPVTLHILL